MPHGDYKAPDRKGLRKFGITTGLIFIGLFALIPMVIKHKTMHWVPPRWPFVPAIPLIVLGVVWPGALGPVHRVWMKAGAMLGWVNTRIILGVVFFVVLTPIGLLMRLFGKDSLGLESHRKKRGTGRATGRSYRVESTPLSRDRMKEPF